MAKASFVEQKPNVVLELTYEEAQVVLVLCRAVGGSCTRRKNTDDIRCALQNTGVKVPNYGTKVDSILGFLQFVEQKQDHQFAMEAIY